MSTKNAAGVSARNCGRENSAFSGGYFSGHVMSSSSRDARYCYPRNLHRSQKNCRASKVIYNSTQLKSRFWPSFSLVFTRKDSRNVRRLYCSHPAPSRKRNSLKFIFERMKKLHQEKPAGTISPEARQTRDRCLLVKWDILGEYFSTRD